jgi:psp operon transcriptional activator
MQNDDPIARLPPLLGESPSFLGMLEHVSRVAPVDRPILVIGERGTGKELVAARLHYLSRRWDRPFVKVNCAALSDELLDSELFGHEAGAFTGATRRHIGRFERAEGGTLFLDEIANASPRVQEKVLRVIEYGEMERVGGSGTLQVDVRVIAATNVDLPAEVAAGRFRADLLDRLAFDVVTLPPLRERVEDISLLAAHFGQAMAHEVEAPGFPGFSARALAELEGHRWPGNVRELRNVVERAVARAPRLDRPLEIVELDPFRSPFRPAGAAAASRERSREEDSPPRDHAGDGPFGLVERVRAFEGDLLRQALARNRFNQRRTAEFLGLSYDRLRHYLRKHGLAGRPDGRRSEPD